MPLIQTSTEVSVVGGTGGGVTVSGVAAANALIAVIWGLTSPTITFSGSDDKSNTWANAIFNGNSTPNTSADIEYALNVASGNTAVTITASSSTSFRFRINEFSTVNTSSAVDTSSSKDEASTTAHTCSANGTVIDTTQADLIIALSTGANTLGTLTPDVEGLGFAQITSASNSVFAQWVERSGADANVQGSFNSTTSRSMAAAIAAFKQTAVAGGTNNNNLLLLGCG